MGTTATEATTCLLTGAILWLKRFSLVLGGLLWFGYQPGLAAVITAPVVTVQPNNGDQGAVDNPNSFQAGSLWLGTVGWASKEFEIEESGGTTKYDVTVTVSNFSGKDWHGYRFWLGLDGEPGDSPAARTGDGLGFSISSQMLPESGPLFLHQRTEDFLDFSGPFADKTSVHFSFSFDMPDGLGVQQIWLFEQPAAAPEPSSFVLLAAGFGLLGAWRYLRARPAG